MVWLLYYILIYLMVAGIRLSSFWNDKSKYWIQGRTGWFQKLSTLTEKSSARIWFHVSSLGEFEQARPVIEKLKARHPGMEIILTFFSPSGYLIRANYPLASVFYLPPDLPGNAEKWLSRIQPDLAVFVKYDLWPGYLRNLQHRKIPIVIISAHWRPGAWFSSWSFPPVKALLKKCDKIFLQRGTHLDYFQQKGFNNIRVAGDTRIDRSLELPAETAQRIPRFLKDSAPFDLVAGSTWPADEKILIEVVDKLGLKALIAPHDVSEENIQRLVKSLPFPALRLSEHENKAPAPGVVIVDNIGLLSVLYAIGEIAYVGGGFGTGIHNILEPMAHAKPLIFGPVYSKFSEAIDMVQENAAISVGNAEDLKNAIQHFQRTGESQNAGNLALNYLRKHAGATDIVTNYILESIPSARER